MSWDDLGWIRDQWPGPLLVKGILDPEDAERAVELGVDGIVVSNHGGRQLEHAQASLDALPAVVAAVGDRAEILLDGGVRRGTDVVKAVALGARAVLIGRPYVYGLIVDGQRGVARILEILRSEIDRTMTLMGVGSIGELDPTWLIPSPGLPAGDIDVSEYA
jgi:L-lactate dehydrogenase (cytochrome)/(S)-mandelate dehydrogenase